MKWVTIPWAYSIISCIYTILYVQEVMTHSFNIQYSKLLYKMGQYFLDIQIPPHIDASPRCSC